MQARFGRHSKGSGLGTCIDYQYENEDTHCITQFRNLKHCNFAFYDVFIANNNRSTVPN
jgi:hypothetical protein